MNTTSTTRQVSYRLPAKQHEALKRRAERLGISLGLATRLIVAEALSADIGDVPGGERAQG